jgi:hypothetical protein
MREISTPTRASRSHGGLTGAPPWTVALLPRRRGRDHGEISSAVESSIILMSDDGLKTAVTFPTLPKMTDVALIPMLGPFGGDQITVAMDAAHPVARTTRGCCSHHGNMFPVSLPVSRRSNVITAKSLL